MLVDTPQSKGQLIWHYLWQNRLSYSLAILFIFLVNLLQVEIPLMVKTTIDLLSGDISQNHDALLNGIFMIIGASMVMIVIRILSRMFGLNPGRFVEAQLKNDLFAKLNRLTDGFHSKNNSGKLISIINNDITGIRLFFGIGFMSMFNIIFALSLTPIYMWRISPSLTLYCLLPIASAFIIYRFGFVQLRAMWTARMNSLQNLSEQLVHFLSGMDVIKAEFMDDWVQQEIAQSNQKLLDVTLKIQRIQVFILPILNYANEVMKILILGLGAVLVSKSELTVGEITAFLSYSVMLAMPFMSLGRILSVLQMGMASLKSVMTILNAKVDPTNLLRLSAEETQSIKRSTLSVKNLTYRYDNNETNELTEPTLKNISFELPQGKKLGILGSIGSGKTTLVNCLNHLLDLEAGCIFYGAQDITQYSRHDWHKQVRTITQEPYLFSATLTENVEFGSKNNELNPNTAGQHLSVAQAIEAAQLTNDIKRFSNQADTIVGEKGIMLSGGQKQRVSIARALYTPADILILDNVLSAVDYETERAIMGELNNKLVDRSLIVVSHRISALQDMDEILVLKEGEIIARGKHQQLLKDSAYYKQTWQLQQSEQQNELQNDQEANS
ncbi:MAG: ABC transporter ATP-binding protein [Saccharospirillaceae bacterium]|nr:ABC transporter ATP-binding protein/permease [Pseudomonadales bacterium]NRB78170.1 ABC transporter ATP-binding protein [Saccharospirillaceae bacterium]